MKPFFSYFFRYIVFPFTKLFIKKIEGEENIPSNNYFVVVSNHLNGRDHCFIGYLFKDRIRNIRFLGAMDSLKIFLQSGMLYYLTDTIKINRKKENRKKVLEKTIKEIDKNNFIVIYPEGDSNPKPNLLRGKSGIAGLVLKKQIPVLPIGIQSKKGKRIIKIGKLMNFSKELEKRKKINSKKEYYLLLREITDKIMNTISVLSNKPYPYEKN